MLVSPPNRKVGVSLSNALISPEKSKWVSTSFGEKRDILNEELQAERTKNGRNNDEHNCSIITPAILVALAPAVSQ